MHSSCLLEREASRLTAVHRYGILDSPAEAQFDDLTLMAAEICATPIGLITLVDSDRIWFKSRVGIEGDVVESAGSVSFCRHAILGDALFEVQDVHQDPRFSSSPLVNGNPGIRFYAGAPLVTSDGYRLGTLCVMDHVPRVMTELQRRALTGLSRQVMRQIEARMQARELSRESREHRVTVQALHQNTRFLHTVINALPVGVYAKRLTGQASDRRAGRMVWNRAAEHLFGLEASVVATSTGYAGFLSQIAAVQVAHERMLLAHRKPVSAPAYPIRHTDGTIRMLRMSSVPVLDDVGEVAYAVGIAEDVTELKEAELKAARASRVDNLTRLPNRAQFFDLLEGALARSRRSGYAIAVIFIDIDGFHTINDSLGPAKGDQVLLAFAGRLKQATRATDMVARLAGDEFVVVLEGLHAPAEAELVAQKILSAVTGSQMLDTDDLTLNFSAGIAYDSTHAHSAAELIGYADELLYVAKSAGGNTVRMTIC